MSHTMNVSLCSLLAFFSVTASAFADQVKAPDDHAPIGVMGDHLHHEGSWMVGYRYSETHTSGLKDGTHTVADTDLVHTYGEVPSEMKMGMHMFEIMYGVTDDLTLMVMPQYMQMSMTHVAHNGHTHSHDTEGFGDTEVTGLYSIWDQTAGNITQKAHLNMGISLPTGDSGTTYPNHHNVIFPLPYNMQFGTGTYDPILGATYTGKSANWSWGAQTLNYIRMGKNDEGYRQGNKYTGTGWVARNVTDFASLSFRLKGEAWENVSGQNQSLPPLTIAGAEPKGQAGERVMANIGVNLLTGGNIAPLAGHRLSAEVGVPVYERFSGPQPKTNYQLTLGWQLAF